MISLTQDKTYGYNDFSTNLIKDDIQAGDNFYHTESDFSTVEEGDEDQDFGYSYEFPSDVSNLAFTFC